MSKVKSPSNHTEESLDWGERMLQHPAFEWVVENSKYLPYVFLALLAIIALGYKLTNGSAVEAEANFQLAEGYQSQILASLGEEDGQAKQTEALSRLREIVGDYPDLQSKYDSSIAQVLLAQGLADEALSYTERTEKRTAHTQSPDFKEFAAISLLISQGSLQEALQKSLAFKETLFKNDHVSLLLPITLIRIAMLHQGLGQQDLEELAWDEWKQYASGQDIKKPNAQDLRTISALFTEGNFSLDEYIEARKI